MSNTIENIEEDLTGGAKSILESVFNAVQDQWTGSLIEANRLEHRFKELLEPSYDYWTPSEHLNETDKEHCKNASDHTKISEKCKKLKPISWYFGVGVNAKNQLFEILKNNKVSIADLFKSIIPDEIYKVSLKIDDLLNSDGFDSDDDNDDAITNFINGKFELLKTAFEGLTKEAGYPPYYDFFEALRIFVLEYHFFTKLNFTDKNSVVSFQKGIPDALIPSILKLHNIVAQSEILQEEYQQMLLLGVNTSSELLIDDLPDDSYDSLPKVFNNVKNKVTNIYNYMDADEDHYSDGTPKSEALKEIIKNPKGQWKEYLEAGKNLSEDLSATYETDHPLYGSNKVTTELDKIQKVINNINNGEAFENPISYIFKIFETINGDFLTKLYDTPIIHNMLKEIQPLLNQIELKSIIPYISDLLYNFFQPKNFPSNIEDIGEWIKILKQYTESLTDISEILKFKNPGITNFLGFLQDTVINNWLNLENLNIDGSEFKFTKLSDFALYVFKKALDTFNFESSEYLNTRKLNAEKLYQLGKLIKDLLITFDIGDIEEDNKQKATAEQNWLATHPIETPPSSDNTNTESSVVNTTTESTTSDNLTSNNTTSNNNSEVPRDSYSHFFKELLNDLFLNGKANINNILEGKLKNIGQQLVDGNFMELSVVNELAVLLQYKRNQKTSNDTFVYDTIIEEIIAVTKEKIAPGNTIISIETKTKLEEHLQKSNYDALVTLLNEISTDENKYENIFTKLENFKDEFLKSIKTHNPLSVLIDIITNFIEYGFEELIIGKLNEFITWGLNKLQAIAETIVRLVLNIKIPHNWLPDVIRELLFNHADNTNIKEEHQKNYTPSIFCLLLAIPSHLYDTIIDELTAGKINNWGEQTAKLN